MWKLRAGFGAPVSGSSAGYSSFAGAAAYGILHEATAATIARIASGRGKLLR